MSSRVVCALFKEGKPLKAFAEACYRLSPSVCLRNNEAVFLEISKTQRLYSENGLIARLHVLAKRYGLTCTVKVADNAMQALAFARYEVLKVIELPLQALSDFAAPFEASPELERKLKDLVEVFSMLGIKRLGAFTELSTDDLAARFGADVVELYFRVRGLREPSWIYFKPEEKIIEFHDASEADDAGFCATTESLLFVFKKLCDRAISRLRARGERASVLRVGLLCPRENRELSINLIVPQGSTSGIFPIVREHLNSNLSAKPLSDAVRAIELEVIETAPGLGTQKNFFSNFEEHLEDWNALVGRLSNKLGKTKVYFAKSVDSYLPEAAWERVSPERRQPADDQKVVRQICERPNFLLNKPIPLVNDGEAFRAEKRKWVIHNLEGPERIVGEWWQDNRGFERDYFRVLTKCGERLWVFKDLSSEKFYLHGFFD